MKVPCSNRPQQYLLCADAIAMSSSYVQLRYTPLVSSVMSKLPLSSYRSSEVSCTRHSSENGDLPMLRH